MRKRPVRVTVWLTESEREEIREACGGREMHATEFMRRTVMSSIRRSRRVKPAFVDGGLFRALDCHLPAS